MSFGLPQSKAAMMRLAQGLVAQHRPVTPAQVAARECSLAAFTKAAWLVIEPATALIWNWHLDAICDHVQALHEGRLSTNNLIITVPPGSAKSRLLSVMYPAWVWAREPGWKGIFASGNPRVSTRDSILTRALIGSAWYRSTFGVGWDLTDNQDQKTLFTNTAGGFRMATTSGSRITGDRAHGLFIDDPLDAQDAYSKASREAVNVWYAQAFANRLNDLRSGKRCLIAQRLHSEDLIGYLLGTEGGYWEQLMIPMEWEESRRFTTSIGWTDPRTEDGAPMFPERFPAHIIDQERQRLGSSGYAGQMQQRPAAAEGELFKRGCLQLLDVDDLPECSQVIISLDTAFSEKQSADYSVAVVIGQHERGVLILDVVRERYAYPQLKGVAKELAARWRPTAVLIEDKASGQSLVQDLQQNTSLPVRAVGTDGDKVSRAHTVTPTWEAKRVFAPRDAPWLDDLEWELYSFPKGAHDDQVDALVQGVRYLTQGDDPLPWLAALGWTPGDKPATEKPQPLATRPGVVVTSLTSSWPWP